MIEGKTYWSLSPDPGTELLKPLGFPERWEYLLLFIMNPVSLTGVYANEVTLESFRMEDWW